VEQLRVGGGGGGAAVGQVGGRMGGSGAHASLADISVARHVLKA